MKKMFILVMIGLFLTGCAIDPPTEPTETVEVTMSAASEPIVTEPTIIPTEPTEPPTVSTTVPPEPDADTLVKVAEFIPGVQQDLRYAGTKNFVEQQIYDFADAYLRYGTVRKLKAVSEELAQQGLGILIWDGFRPLKAQEKLWEICPDTTYVSHPVTGSRSHCRGSAIDLTLVELESGDMLRMPTDFDDFSALADRDYSDCTEEAAENARLLEEVMKKHGFKPYSAKWWHYSDTEEYPVEEHFWPEQTVFEGGVG